MTEPSETLLAPLRDAEPATPPAYDLDRAIRDGRRNISRRNLLVGSAAAAVLVAAGGAVGTLRPPTGSMPVAWMGPRGAAGAATDPATLTFRLAWSPATPVVDVSTSEYGQRTQHIEIGSDSHYRVAAEVGMYARGAGWRDPLITTDTPLYGQPGRTGMPDGEPGPTIGGQRSVWLSKSASGASVVWPWSPGAYAVAAARTAEMVERLVNGIRLVNEPVRAPFTAPRPPVALKLRETSVTHGPGETYAASLAFSDRADLAEPGKSWARMVRYDVIRDARRDNAGSDKIPAPTSIVDGHPAHVAFANGGELAWLFDVDGFLVEVGAWDPASLRLLGGAGAVLRTARRIRPVASPDKQSSWLPPLS
ncbi:hypothetical protein [Fodinicola acaciae]|uniref:hypothetical protein n=1 Tax=Fodinicola acaciae TaxID=2681555 RepID=UPI0013CF7074|nr:hypothetical protein [Fodinicola acaciae]